MTTQEQDQFRTEFKSLVYKKGLISESAKQLSRLEIWNKNDSHKSAILKEIEKLNKLRAEYKQMLSGKSYEEWKTFSKKLSVLNGRLKTAMNNQMKAQEAIAKLNFLFHFVI